MAQGRKDLGSGDYPWLKSYAPGIPHSIDYPDVSLSSLLENAAQDNPDNLAARCFEGSINYHDLLKMSRQFAHALKELGHIPGSRLGILLPNVPEYIVAIFGAWMAGVVPVQFSPLMVENEIEKLVDMTDCHTIVTLDVLSRPCQKLRGPGKIEKLIIASLEPHLGLLERWLYPIELLRRGVKNAAADNDTIDFVDLIKRQSTSIYKHEIDPESPALIQPTGGTTGTPKGVVLSHRSLMANTLQLAAWYNIEAAGESKVLAVVPFFHCYGLTVALLGTVALGGSLTLCPRFNPRVVVKLVERHKPTMLPGVPALYSALNAYLAKKPADLSCLRYCVSGASGLPAKVRAEFESYGAQKLLEGYGLSEASPVTHVNPLQGGDRQGSIGLPLPDTDARVIDLEDSSRDLGPGSPGELVVRGPQLMSGYLDDEEGTRQVLRDGWLYTGDIATYDEDGFFKIVDRMKDLIKTSGYNVFPIEVEEVIRKLDNVADVAVVGVPDDEKGELVKAYIIPAPESVVDIAEVERLCKEQLAKHKQPKSIELCDELPRNFLGKVLRRELRTKP